MNENYVTVVFENGRTITRRAYSLGNVKDFVPYVIRRENGFGNDVLINWDNVLCARAATPIEVQTEKQREGQE